jgi:DNA-binding protein HU-beta
MAPRNDMTSTLCDTARPFDSRGTPAVTATELVAKLAETHGVSKAQAKSIVDDIMKNILDAAASGAEVSLPGFGKFKVKATPEREGRNPANGEKIKIAASKKLTFSSAKSVKDLLNGRAELPGN